MQKLEVLKTKLRGFSELSHKKFDFIEKKWFTIRGSKQVLGL
jgi:hypothetical protein